MWWTGSNAWGVEGGKQPGGGPAGEYGGAPCPRRTQAGGGDPGWIAGPGGGCHLPLCQADSPPGSGGRGGGTDPRDHRHPHPPGGGGHCQLVLEGMVFEGPEELERWAALPETSPGLPICLVSQTTLTANLWNLCVKIVKNSLLTSEFLIQYAKQQNIGKKKRHTCQKSVKLWLLWVMPRVPTRAVLR